MVHPDVVVTILNGGIRQRFLTAGGVDQQLVVRTAGQNLALIGDRERTTRVAVKPDGTAQPQAVYWSRDAWGAPENPTGSGWAINTETGRTGASTPNQTGGFTYLRNRWYDPATGRFLTQDPIGLAGGVNLYAYAGNNPIAFSDPYGLCPIPPGSCLGRAGLSPGLGSVPVVSTVLDAATVITGRDVITGERASRVVALAGLVTPAGGAQIRAGADVAEAGV